MKRTFNLLVLVTLLALTFGAAGVTPALAAPLDLSNNLSSTPSGNVAYPSQSYYIAQSFSTTATHFIITQVSLPMCRYSGTTGNLVVEIYSSDLSTGHPGVMLATVSNSQALSDLQQKVAGTPCPIVDFIPSTGITLNPSTEYYLVVKTTSASVGAWDYTLDEGGTGFPSKYIYSMNSGASWGTAHLNDPQMMRIVADEPAASDTTPPVVTVPSDITAEATSSAGAVVNFVTSATDETSPANPTVTCSPVSGSTFALGTTPVTCQATDDAGNTGYGYFNVTVVDTTPPIIAVPANMIVEATGPSGAIATFVASGHDDVGMGSVTCTPPSGSTFALGTTTVNCTATDAAGNSASDSFTVTVQDTTAPTLTLPANITVPQVIPAGAVVNFSVSATDEISPANPTVTCDWNSGSTFPVGTTTVNCSATDDFSNTSNGSFTVTVTAATGGNLLKKPDFPNATIFPTPWQLFGVVKPFSSAIDCKVFQSSACSVLFNSGKRSALQRVSRSGLAGDTYFFGLSSSALNVPVAGKYRVEVVFLNNLNRAVGSTSINFTIGTHSWETVSGYATATGNYKSIVFRFYYQKSGGRAWFDDAFLYFIGAP